MCIFSINNQEKADALISSYKKWHDRFEDMLFIPVIALVGGIGTFALDAKTLFINKLFTEKAYRAQIAANTYDSPGNSKDFSATVSRVFSAFSILTCGVVGFLFLLAILFANCCCSKNCQAQ